MSKKIEIPGYTYDISNMISDSLQKAIDELSFVTCAIRETDVERWSDRELSGFSWVMGNIRDEFVDIAKRLDDTGLYI